MDQVKRRRAGVVVGMLLSSYLLVFFWVFLGELRWQVFPFLAGMAVTAVWALVVVPADSTGLPRPDGRITVLGTCIYSMYTILAGALVGVVLLEGPRSLVRLITLAAVVSLALLIWPVAKQTRREYIEARSR